MKDDEARPKMTPLLPSKDHLEHPAAVIIIHLFGGNHGVVMLFIDRHTAGRTGVVAVPQQLGGQGSVVRMVPCSDSDYL